MEIKMTTRPAAAQAGSLLRASVLLDVAISGTSAAATLLTARRWDSWFGVPTGWAAGLGVFFVAWTLTCAAVARRPVPRVVAVLGAANLGYALVSVLAGAEQVWPLTGWGEAVLVAQTVGVAGIGALQLYATRR
jgi:hypothetical protein